MARLNCPKWVLAEIQPGLAIEYWGRRAFYECIEELGVAMFWGFVIANVGYGLSLISDSEIHISDGVNISVWWIVAFILMVAWPGRDFAAEFMRWRHEIYVVARNDERGGGEFYKFYGWLSTGHKSDPITDRSPGIITSNPFPYRVWGFLTGEQMRSFKISSDNNIFIDGRRVSPEIEQAIRRVRAAEPRSVINEFEHGIQWTREIDRLAGQGMLDLDEAKHSIEAIVRGFVWGQG